MENKIEEVNCGIEHIRDYPSCYEDCDYGDTDTCPHHKKFEPKPDDKLSPYSLPSDAYDKYFTHPDERLLAAKEIDKMVDELIKEKRDAYTSVVIERSAKAQLANDLEWEAKTASIKDAEWKGKEKEYLEAIEDARLAGYLSGKEEIKKKIETLFFTDLTTVPGRRYIYEKAWREFWKQEEIK